MESVPLGPPSTLTRATSAGPSPPRRNPMEDADSSVTRKRPRLDSGERTHRSMSADRITTAPSALEPSPPPFTPTRGGSSSNLVGGHTFISPNDRTPSKVTINVRGPIHNGSPSLPETNGTHHPAQSDKGEMHSPSQTESSVRIESRSSDVISVSSSPSRSPEIEVAEVEDINAERGETRWRPLTSLIDAKDTQGALLDAFPYGVRDRLLRQTVILVSQAIEKNTIEDSQVLKSLTDWIEMYLQATESNDSQWWDMYVDEREFWDELPSIIEALLRRCANRFGAQVVMPMRNDDEPVSGQHFEDFLIAFTGLVSRMVLIDCQTMEECTADATMTPDFVSQRYLNGLVALTAPMHGIWKSLSDLCHYDSRPTITNIITRFTYRPANGIKRLSQIVKGLFDRSQTIPGLAQKIWLPLRIVYQMMQHHNSLLESNEEVHKNLLKSLRHLPSEAYELFQTIDATFQVFVSKQVSVLSLETSQALVQHLSPLLLSIATADDELTAYTLRSKLGLRQEFDKCEGPLIVELAWKFELLKKCILEGRMEIRVQGVETMQSELVGVYNRYIQRTRAQKDHPVAQYLSDFMLANRLVEYFVGVESHPQLISRCGNIIGFLVITSRYTEAESDAIWKAVMTSQDSRIVDAILLMLLGFFKISLYPNILYLTKKLNELSLEAFDSSMINYGSQLLESLRLKWKEFRQDSRMDMPPYDLCIRLIRQAAAEKRLPYHRTREIHNFAVNELQNLLALGPSDVDRRTIYQDCVKDISSRTKFATGSVSAINALLGQNPEGDIRMLANDYDLTNLIIQEFSQATDAETTSPSTPRTTDEGLAVRLELLQSIITHIPDTITPKAGQLLWDVMQGHETISDQARLSAWSILGKATRMSIQRNSFIDRCVGDYLPQLKPRFITSGCLAFVNQVVQYESRLANQRPEEQHSAGALGDELLWHLSLVAPSGGIELHAIHMLVALYLDFHRTQNSTQAALESMQVEVVERCIRHLKNAASHLKAFSDGTSSGEDEPMVVVATEEEINVQRTTFARSLLILKEFVQGIRSRPRYSPPPQQSPPTPLNPHNVKGDSCQIRYQLFSGGTNTGIHSVEIGDLETIEDLSQRLVALTGFSKFTAISGGQFLDLTTDSHLTLRETKLNQKGLLIVKKSNDADSIPDLAPAPGFRPLELEVMRNFREIYELLGMEEGLAKEVFEFLVAFPPHESVTAIICSKDTSLETAFPPTMPFKILYSVYALKTCLLHQLQNGTSSQGFICRGVQLLATTLITPGLVNGTLDSEVDLSITAGLVDCLLRFLKEPVSAEVAAHFLPDARAFVEHLQSLIPQARSIPTPQANSLVCNCFATILEASLHCKNIWEIFKSANQCSSLFRCLLLEDRRPDIRQGVAESIRGICCTLSTDSTTSGQDIVSYVWSNLVLLIPESLQHEKTSQQFFEIALIVLRAIDSSGGKDLDLPTYIQDWSSLLLQHKHEEFVGRDSIDWVIHGISILLNWCIQLAKPLKKPLNVRYDQQRLSLDDISDVVRDDLTESLFRAHLFPEISNFNGSALIYPQVPTLHSKTRQELYSIISALSNDMIGYEKLLKLVRDLLPQGEDSNAWSWGIAQILEDYSYEANWNFERSKSIRSPTGYPGLRNLSNTCYLNSLFTQLYMNVGFRKFMLNAHIADSNSSQRLLYETKTLFAFMQETMLRSVDPQGIADSVITYENTLIDVSVQMDVDEFYNLLFDRWESQILSDVGKKTFRRFYGGQIVQQIKSKECPHLSEKIEPFSAIQCDIQGKATLIESLDAYVGGEVMEGDNKYSCTSCGCYVDAVKRACLKDIPNNLIFHLKRFDYDVMTGMRSKINDRFEFPEMINMSPYHIDYLKDPEQPPPQDIFELVGILVHSGTAESGHYYSYIRERPARCSQQPTWVEFNDADVSKFDHANIPDQCFGGPTDASPFSSVRFPKTWNAYMLFYQRVDDMESECREHMASPVGVPAKAELPLELSNRISVENELFIRRYCLFDAAHAAFARSLLEQLRVLSKGTCSDDHVIEREAIWLALEHLDQILSRPKDSAGFDKMLNSLTKVIGTCSDCCKLALDWVVDHKYALRNLLLRSPSPKVRRDFSGMILTALQYLRHHDPRLYGFDIDAIELEPADGHFPAVYGALQGIVNGMKDLWPIMYQHGRAWDDYFGLLVEIANSGVSETHVLLRGEFLLHCFEILLLDHAAGKRLRNEVPHYASYYRLLEKGRKFSLVKLLEFVRVILDRIDLEPRPLALTHQDRALGKGKMMLNGFEEEYLRYGTEPGRSRTLIVLDKILCADQNSYAAREIIRIMVGAEPEFGLLTDILKTITSGISIDPASLAAPYLGAGLTFCEVCPSPSTAKELINYVAREIDTIGMSGGKEHLEFFAQARRLQNIRIVRNPQFFSRTVLHSVPQWAPPLMMYWEESVRTGTIDLLRTLVFNRDTRNMDNEQEAEDIERIARELCQSCIKRIQTQIIDQQKAVENRNVESIVMVIRHCLQTYYQMGEHDEDHNTVLEAEHILDALSTLTVLDAEEAVSDWANNDSDMNTEDSESENLMDA